MGAVLDITEMMKDGFSTFSFWGFVFFVISILIMREIYCWYGKTNQIVVLLTEIRNELRKQNKSEAANVKDDL
jgi:hypothetical protein